MSRTKSGQIAAIFAAGFFAVIVSGTVVMPAAAKWERPLGGGKCAPPKGTCLRFVTSAAVPDPAEVERLNSDGFDVVYTLPSGKEVFWPSHGGGDLTVQDIGL